MEIKTFLKDHKVFLLQLGIITSIVLFMPDTSYATDVNGTKISINALDTPLNTFKDALTGPVPKIGTTIAAAVGATSWSLGLEQQITKLAIRATVGGGCAIGAGELLQDVTGCLF